MPKLVRERCDHCQKWVNDHHGLYTLEDSVSPGLDWQFGICGRCFNKHPASDRDYWDSWVKGREPLAWATPQANQ